MRTKTFTPLYSRTSTGAVQTWSVETEHNKYRTHYGQIDGAIQTTEWTVCHGKNKGKANSTTDDEQAEIEAFAMWEKKIASGYFEDPVCIDNETFTEPMLAKKYEDYEDDIEFPVYSQPKLDGIRCITKRNGMWSRAGKPITSAPHVLKHLKYFFERYPDVTLDGELYCDKLNNDFNKICSLVKKTKPTMDDLNESEKTIQYWIYDCIDSVKYPAMGEKFSDRYDFIFRQVVSTDSIKTVVTAAVSNYNLLDSLYGGYIEQGFEGQMVRLNGKYENKRSKNLLKRKEFKDDEYTILGVVEGEGNRTGMAGAMLFKNPKGLDFRSNIKGNRDWLKQLWKEKASLIGKQATIKYFNLTPDKIPRFPYVTSIRDYE